MRSSDFHILQVNWLADRGWKIVTQPNDNIRLVNGDTVIADPFIKKFIALLMIPAVDIQFELMDGSRGQLLVEFEDDEQTDIEIGTEFYVINGAWYGIFTEKGYIIQGPNGEDHRILTNDQKWVKRETLSETLKSFQPKINTYNDIPW